MRLLKRDNLLNVINGMVIDLPSPSNISYMWNYGSLLGLCLVIQLITGIALAMHYTPHINLAFSSIEHIMRDVNYGWLLRYIHMNTASMFFLMVYLHIGRGLYYGSYNRPHYRLWLIGVAILFLMMATAFIGYVLPWGQMSFWGATVITNLLSAIPYLGNNIVQWIWGGFAIDNATLTRFFSFHYVLPFLIVGLVILHLITLHEHGSNNPLGISSSTDKVPFHPYFIVKDLVGVLMLCLLLSAFLFYAPNYLGHPDNYIPANPLVTPPHIVPEWYFLFAYAILRSIPNKLAGVIALFSSLIILALTPFLHKSSIRSNAIRPLGQIFYWIFVGDFLLLTWLGGNPVEEPYVQLSQICTTVYFMYFLIIVPILGWIENTLFNLESEQDQEGHH